MYKVECPTSFKEFRVAVKRLEAGTARRLKQPGKFSSIVETAGGARL